MAKRYIDAAPYEDGRIVLNKEDDGVPVAEIPTADVVERKKGRWLNKGGKICCSVCGRTNFLAPNFCPECGTDMRGEKQDG